MFDLNYDCPICQTKLKLSHLTNLHQYNFACFNCKIEIFIKDEASSFMYLYLNNLTLSLFVWTTGKSLLSIETTSTKSNTYGNFISKQIIDCSNKNGLNEFKKALLLYK